MMVDGLMFDRMISLPFAVKVRCMRAKASVRPHILDDVVMHVVVKGGVFEFIGHGITSNRILLCESLHYWFEFVTMYKTQMTHVKVTKKV